MKLSSPLLSLSILLGSGISLVPSTALAGDVTKLVETTLLQPLARREAERGRFSRVRMPPADRQVRVLGHGEDPAGRTFVRFAVDEKRSDEWQRDVTTGCAYLDDGTVFVSRHGSVQSAAQYLGQPGPRATTECTAATVASKR
jgi:hypothetical protein